MKIYMAGTEINLRGHKENPYRITFNSGMTVGLERTR